MAMPLDGIRVIDWTAFQHGPVASMLLGDLGADVIKVEALGGGDPARGRAGYFGVAADLPGDRASYFEVNNRNKKSIAVDLRHPQGRDIIYRLVERSDVFLNNFRLGVADRLGLGYDRLHERNPRLVYACTSGFGPEGPESKRPGFDFVASARSGFMDAISMLDTQPPRQPATGFADQYGAGVLAMGIVAALFWRERTGIGQKVEGSLLGSMLWFQTIYINGYLLVGGKMPRVRHNEALSPIVNAYRCRDGKWLYFVLPQFDRFWPDFCKAVGRPDLERDQRYDSLEHVIENHEALIAELDEVIATRTSLEWIDILRHYPDFVYQTVNAVPDLLDDPQVKANDYIVDYRHPALGMIKALNAPVSLSETPGGIRLPAPGYGEHTEEVLAEVCGYSRDEVAAFRAAGAI